MSLHDSGKRETFATGMVRDAMEGKPRPELVTPYGLERLAMHYARGAQKYEDRNWEKGSKFSRTTASLERHVIDWKKGKTNEDHLAAIAWNAFALMHYQEMVRLGKLPADLDDMPHYEQDPLTPPATMLTALVKSGEVIMPVPTTRMRRVYISGPMRGIPQHNFPAFDEARDRFKGWGWDVWSPADADRHNGCDEQTPDRFGPADIRVFAKRDMEALLSFRAEDCDAIAMLPGWENSKGAKAERALACWLGLRSYDAVTGNTLPYA